MSASSDYIGQRIGVIFDELEGKSYSESWNMLQIYSYKVIKGIAKGCPHPDAKEAAESILDNKFKLGKRHVKTASVAVFLAFFVVLSFVAVTGLLFRWDMHRDNNAANMGNAYSDNDASAIVSAGVQDIFIVPNTTAKNNTDEQITFIVPKKAINTSPTGPMPRWNDVASDAFLHNTVGVFGSGSENSYTAFFETNPFSDIEFSGATDALASHIENNGLFHIRLLDANFPNTAMNQWHDNYDRHQIMNDFGNPEILEKHWVKDLNGNMLPVDYLTAILVISPGDKYGIAFDTEGVFTVVEIAVVN